MTNMEAIMQLYVMDTVELASRNKFKLPKQEIEDSFCK
jgi:hypothetical protein